MRHRRTPTIRNNPMSPQRQSAPRSRSSHPAPASPQPKRQQSTPARHWRTESAMAAIKAHRKRVLLRRKHDATRRCPTAMSIEVSGNTPSLVQAGEWLRETRERISATSPYPTAVPGTISSRATTSENQSKRWLRQRVLIIPATESAYKTAMPAMPEASYTRGRA